MRFSVLLRTRESAAELPRFEEGLKRGWNVVVVDHRSSDQTREIARGWQATVVDWNREEYSFGGAINAGVPRCEGEWILVMSPHASPVGLDFWKDLERDLEGLGEDVMACQIPIAYPGPQKRKKTGIRILDETKISTLHREEVSNTCCAYRKSALLEMPFDERLSAAEDVDWVHRALRRGWQIAIDGNVAVLYENRAPLRRYWEKGKTDLPAVSAILGVNCIPSRAETLYVIAKDIVRVCIGRIPPWWWMRLLAKRLAELTLSRTARA